MARDLYEVIGVKPEATKEEIASAYKKAALRVHPDRNPGDPGATNKFVELNSAYAVLSDEERRKAYDRHRAPARDPMDEINDIFTRFHGFRWGDVASAVENHQKGKDVDLELRLTLREAVMGVVKTIRSSTGPEIVCDSCRGARCAPGTGRAPCTSCAGTGFNLYPGGFRGSRVPCRSCRGFGDIPFRPCTGCAGGGKRRAEREVLLRIPCGVSGDQKLRLAGQGEVGTNGMSGDMIVTLKVEDDKSFVRKGQDLFTSTRIPFHSAVMRGPFEVLGIDGTKHLVRTVEEIKSGDTVVSIPGAGVPSMTGGAGRLHSVLHVDMPFPRTARAAMLLNELLAEMTGQAPRPPPTGVSEEFDASRDPGQ